MFSLMQILEGEHPVHYKGTSIKMECFKKYKIQLNGKNKLKVEGNMEICTLHNILFISSLPIHTVSSPPHQQAEWVLIFPWGFLFTVCWLAGGAERVSSRNFTQQPLICN